MHALSYHVPVFIKNHKMFKQFTGQGVEKNSDDAKRIFFKSQINGMQLRMRCSWRCNSKPSITVKGKRENITNKTMNTGIVELLNHVKKECILGMVQVQVILKVKHLLQTVLKYQLQIMKKMAVKQFVQEIKSRNLQVNGKSKLKKGQLTEVLKNSD